LSRKNAAPWRISLAFSPPQPRRFPPSLHPPVAESPDSTVRIPEAEAPLDESMTPANLENMTRYFGTHFGSKRTAVIRRSYEFGRVEIQSTGCHWGNYAFLFMRERPISRFIFDKPAINGSAILWLSFVAISTCLIIKEYDHNAKINYLST
jgi:hypothetical protein